MIKSIPPYMRWHGLEKTRSGHGNVVKRSWLHYYTDPTKDQKPKRIFMAWDTTVKDGGQSDWTVCTVWQLLDRVHYLLHVERGIYEYPELRRTFIALVQTI